MSKDKRGVILAYIGIGLLLLPFPLFGILHAEASAVVAAVSFLVSALATARGGMPRMNEWPRFVLPAFVPAVLLLFSMVWRPNCGWALGLFLYTLFVMPSVILGASVGAAVRTVTTRFRTVIVVSVWLFLLVVPTLVTLKNHPQFFVYNSVFGGVLGPIYDDELSLRAGFFWHRLRTLLWATWPFLFVRWRSSASWRTGEKVLTVVLTVVLGAMILFQAPLGIVQTEGRIAQALGAEHRSASLVVHFDSLSLSRQDAALIAREQEYRRERIAGALELSDDALERPIHVFIYPDEETKGRLTGARQTSVAPVWLEIPQVHVLQSRVWATLTHEMVHVLARSFGEHWTGASWSIGLVEGLAAALEPPQGYPALDAQVVAASQLPENSPAVLRDPPHAASSLMSPWRFWTSRQAMAYAVSGAFTEYLLDTYGAGALKKSYRTASFDDAYGRPLDSLGGEWGEWLVERRADSTTVAWVQWVFAQPSLFERRCPHYVPRWVRRVREAEDLRNQGRFREALSVLEDLRSKHPNNVAITSQWAGVALAAGTAPDSVATVLDAFPDSLAGTELLVRRADAHRMAGWRDADSLYGQAIAASSPFPATTRAFIRLRSRLGGEALRLVFQGTDVDSSRVNLAEKLEVLSEAGVFAAAFYASEGRYDQAWSTFEQENIDTLPSDEQRAVLLYALDWAIASGRFERAREIAAPLAVDDELSDNPLKALASDRLEFIRWLKNLRR